MAAYRTCIRQRLEMDAAKEHMGELAENTEAQAFFAFLEASERGIPLDRQSG